MRIDQIKKLCLLFLLPLLLNFLSCDVTEPGRYFNEETTKARYGRIVFENFDTTMALDGSYTINFRLDSANFQPYSVLYNFNFSIDRYIQPQNGVYSFTVNSSEFPKDSSYPCRISIVPANLGLISTLGIKAFNIQFPIKVHTGKQLSANLKTPVVNDSVMLRWDKCIDNLFKSYSVVRRINNVYDTITVITNPDICSYTDNKLPQIYGEGAVSYKLVTKSSVASIASSEYKVSLNNCCAVLPFNKHIYSAYLQTPGMGLISQFDQTTIEHYDISLNKKLSGSGLPSSPVKMELSRDGSKVFLRQDSDYGFYVLDFSGTISNPKYVSLYGPNAGLLNKYVEIRPGLLFISYREVVMGTVYPSTAYYDCASGTFSRHYQNLPDLSSYSFFRSIDNNAAYAQRSDSLYRMDFSDTSNVRLTYIGSFPILYNLIELSADRKVLFDGRNLLAYDRNFNLIGHLTFGYVYVQLYLSNTTCVSVGQENGSGPNRVEVFNLADFKLLKSALIKASINCALSYPDGSVVINATEFLNSGTFERYLKLN